MKTIKERAYQTYPISKDDWDDTIEWTTMADILEDKQEAYIQGATDQQKIDIERSCELYRKELEQAELVIKSVNPKGLGLIDIDESVKKFKHAMEG